MSTLKTKFINGQEPMPTPVGSEVVSVRMEYDLAAALAASDVLEFGLLPAGCVPVDWDIDTDQLDTNGTPTLAADIGILDSAGTAISTAAADGGGKWASALAVGHAAALTRAATIYHKRVTSDDVNDRTVAAVISTGPATGAASGKIALTLSYRAAYQSE